METSEIHKNKVKTYRDLNVYQQSFELADEIFKVTAGFPTEERYSLIDQMRRASRSVPANLAEGWAKRTYENILRGIFMNVLGPARR